MHPRGCGEKDDLVCDDSLDPEPAPAAGGGGGQLLGLGKAQEEDGHLGAVKEQQRPAGESRARECSREFRACL